MMIREYLIAGFIIGILLMIAGILTGLESNMAFAGSLLVLFTIIGSMLNAEDNKKRGGA